MHAWQVYSTSECRLVEIASPAPTPGRVVVDMQAAPVLSYLGRVLDGSLGYALPPLPFVPGTNGIGVVRSVGQGVYHLEPGDRVLLDPRLIANERVTEPAQILIGLTATGSARFGDIAASTVALQADVRDGTFAEQVSMPASVITKLPAALDVIPAARLVGLSKFLVPYGGFVRAGLEVGECVIVNGASGYFGAAAALLALSLGARRVVAAGRDRAALTALAGVAGPRLSTVVLGGDLANDTQQLMAAAGGRADLAIDIVGRAGDASSTQSALYALRRAGRLVLMGSLTVPLPVAVGDMLSNDWQIMGCFMYPESAPARLAGLVASGQLDLSSLNVRSFALSDLTGALEAATKMRGLDLTVLEMNR